MLKSLLDESAAAVPVVEALLTFAECRKFSLILRKDLSVRPGLCLSLNVICYTTLHLAISPYLSLWKFLHLKMPDRISPTIYFGIYIRGGFASSSIFRHYFNSSGAHNSMQMHVHIFFPRLNNNYALLKIRNKVAMYHSDIFKSFLSYRLKNICSTLYMYILEIIALCNNSKSLPQPVQYLYNLRGVATSLYARISSP